jgi:DNA-binding XRE family transcriptional regulator
MPGPTSKDGRKRAREVAFAQHSAPVLENPDSYSRLRVERARRNLTQAELGRMPSVRMKAEAISHAERATNPPMNTKLRIAYALEMPVEELFPPNA